MVRVYRLFFGALLAGAPVALGCATLLGDFELQDDGGGGAGSGSATGASGYAGVTTGASDGGYPFPTGSGSGYPFPTGSGSGFPFPGSDGGFPFPDFDSGVSYPAPDPGGTDPCGPGSTAEISNDFDADVIDSNWSAPQDPTAPIYAMQEAGELHLHTDGAPKAFGSLVWKGSLRSLRKCHVSVAVKEVVDEALGVQTGMDVDDGQALEVRNSLRIVHNDGKIRFRQTLNGSSTMETAVSYDPKEHAFWRVREINSKVLFQTSPDGVVWKTWHQVETQDFVDAVRVRLFISASDKDTATTSGIARFDNLNLPP